MQWCSRGRRTAGGVEQSLKGEGLGPGTGEVGLQELEATIATVESGGIGGQGGEVGVEIVGFDVGVPPPGSGGAGGG